MDDIQIDRYFDRSSLKVAEGRNNSDAGVSSIKDDKWVKRYFDNLTIKVVKKRNKPAIGKGRNNSGAPVTWIDRYFNYLSSRVAYDGSPKQVMYPRSEIKEPSIDLQSSLKMFFQKAACYADDWTDVHTKYNDRRSFSAFLDLLEPSGLEKYDSNEDDDINIRYLQDKYWLSLKVSPDVVVANECYGGSLLLMNLLQKIRSESGDHFGREKARFLESFLDHLIKIQQEQWFVSYSFSEHLEQLRKCDVVAFSSNVIDDDGDGHKCPLICSEHAMESYMWQQKVSLYTDESISTIANSELLNLVLIFQHVFDSLCVMSCESAWLLKTLKDSYFTSPSFIKVSNKILDIILVYILKFKESKESLDQYLLDECCRFNDQLAQLVMQNDEILNDFGGCINNLLEQGVERKSIAETLIVCFADVVNMHCNRAARGNPFRDTCNHTAANNQLDQIRLSIKKILTVAEVTYMLRDAFTTGGAGMKGLSDVTHNPGTSSKQDGQGMDFNLDDFPWDKHNDRSATIGHNTKKFPKYYEG
ncbi:hypothetical protein MKX03_022963 [Papaver bracteatum]|nr:hypothetical protein MKX03_022963 [Papaver bracteatum]